MAISNPIRARLQKEQLQARVMFCLSGDSEFDLILIRKARQEIAAGSCTAWIAYGDFGTRRVNSRPRLFPSLQNMAALARNIGAQFVSLGSADAATAIIEFARNENIDRIVVHCEPRTRWRRWLRRSIVQRLIDHGQGFQIELVGLRHIDKQPRRAQIIPFNAISS